MRLKDTKYWMLLLNFIWINFISIVYKKSKKKLKLGYNNVRFHCIKISVMVKV